MKYIIHDSSAIDDEKLTELIMEFGYEGYGLFWAILEKLAKQEKPVKTDVLKKQLNVGKKLNKCWNFMESLGIISSNNGETFNKQLLNYAGSYKIKNEKNAERVAEWRDKQRFTKNVTHYVQDCNTYVTPLKESKVNINKEKESKETLFDKNSDKLIPIMWQIFIEKNPNYAGEFKDDAKVLYEISSFICKKIKKDFKTPQLFIEEIKPYWQKIVDFCFTHNFFRNYDLSQILKYFVSIIQTLNNEGTNNNKGKPVPITADGLRKAHARTFGTG